MNRAAPVQHPAESFKSRSKNMPEDHPSFETKKQHFKCKRNSAETAFSSPSWYSALPLAKLGNLSTMFSFGVLYLEEGVGSHGTYNLARNLVWELEVARAHSPHLQYQTTMKP